MTIFKGRTVRGYRQVSPFNSKLETLYAEFDDGTIVQSEMHPISDSFISPAWRWKKIPKLPDGIDYIGYYPKFAYEPYEDATPTLLKPTDK